VTSANIIPEKGAIHAPSELFARELYVTS
jgi:hypothetical protein